MFLELGLALVAFAAYLYITFHRNSKFWTNQGVKTAGGNCFPFGNSVFLHKDVLREKANPNDIVLEQYNEMKDEPFYGMAGPLGAPMLMLRDLELIKAIMVKDFPNFVNRNQVFRFKGEADLDIYWTKQMTNMQGAEWKAARQIFTPIFTSGKMKMMTSFIEMVSKELEKEVDRAHKADEAIDLKTLLGKFSMDTIAACAFGVDSQSFTNKDSQFVKYARNIFRKAPTDIIAFLTFIIPGLQKVFNVLNISMFKKTETAFLAKTLKETLRQRQNSKQRRNDIIDLMLDALKTEEGGTAGFDETMVIATAMIILVAGYDTTALTMSYIFYQLAMKPDIQARLQEEVDEACQKAGNNMPDYGAIQSMEYLDMVIHEALRFYSPVAVVTRGSLADYKIPGSNVVIPGGSEVHIPVFGIHRDRRYYDTPDEFNPEHFTKEAKASRHPFAFLAFGQGPRNCIGMRFALLEAKMGIVSLLSRYNVNKCSETPEKTTFDPCANLGNCLEPLMVKMEKRQSPSM